MGARIDGVSTSTLTIEGVDRLAPGRAHHRHRPDRRRHLGLRQRDRRRRPAPSAAASPHHLDIVLDKLVVGRRRGRATSTAGSRCAIDRRLSSFDVVTLPYPGFPTDLQPFAMALAAVCDGHRDDHRERLRGAVHVRPGARPARRRPAHRRPPRRRPRRAACSPAPRWSPTTSGPAPRWCSPGLAAQGTTDGGRVAAHRPRLPVVRGGAARRSAPRSSRLARLTTLDESVGSEEYFGTAPRVM